MNRSYETSQDSWDQSVEAETDVDGRGRPALGALVAGGLALVGGGLLAAGPYLRYAADDRRSELDMVVWPEPLLLVALAGLVAAVGLFTLFAPRRPFGSACAAAVVVPAATLVAFQGPTVIDVLVSGGGTGSLRLGGWLVAGGAAATALAALAAFAVLVARSLPARGVVVPFLGAVAAAGMLQWWTVSPIERDGEPVLHYLNVDTGGSAWPGTAVLGALALAIAAVTVAAARSGAAALGTALGAALAMGAELGGRYLVSERDLRDGLGNAELRTVPVVLTGAAVAVLLVVVLGLAVKTARVQAESTDAALASWQQSSTSTEDGWSATGTGTSTAASGGSWSGESSSDTWAADSDSTHSSQSGQSSWT